MDVKTALVLAGTRAGAEDPLAVYAGVSHKALIEVGGRTMIERVVTALAALPGLERILISTERADLLQACRGLRACAPHVEIDVIPAATGPSASVAAAFERCGAPLLVTTADHALLRLAWITDFLAGVPAGCDVAALLAPRAAVMAARPETHRTFLRFADGAWSGCNLFWLATPRAAEVVRFWQSIEAERKHPARLVRRLGLCFALRYRCGRLTLGDALERLHTLCGARAAVVESADGLAAIDVDKPADLDLVRRIVAETAEGGIQA
ncbi:MAG: hypothetical protein EPN72_09090 [Nevskiaceae bacterium]|nr:MAG: hypothetical protein EPN63_08430 [Nevskiaceae bacterium]TBR72593.1 MAG: hypothetical protein EPN72_09090 [Nevskiaceae bacterium]